MFIKKGADGQKLDFGELCGQLILGRDNYRRILQRPACLHKAFSWQQFIIFE
jgi:hypothetical protein